ncbi:MAG: primase C-terminal domain-containing protein [Ignavibacteriales bacterium]|nr:MAG: primase C-terminal domain-containing protein [Ignavibacteriales bacterium]
METLLEYAKHYNSFELKIIPLIISENGKKPFGRWKQLVKNPQSLSDLEKINWHKNINGIGVINGNYQSLDFDKCSDEKFILKLADELGINSWIVKSGFGFHFHFELEDIEFIHNEFGIKSYYSFEALNKKIFDHCELRLSSVYTALPPSNHYNGNTYSFLSGIPESKPQKISAKKINDVLQKYFIVKSGLVKDINSNAGNEILDYLTNGVSEGNRHKALIKIFGTLFNQGITKEFIKAQIENWNLRNNPPINDKELQKQFNDLWNRYSKGLDGKFHQFQNCLFQLDCEPELKLKKILCYGVLEFNSDTKIISDLELDSMAIQYHLECKKLITDYEQRTGKRDQIVRVGEKMFLDTLKKKIRFDYFFIYTGIISYLGRNATKPAKKISHSIISYRAIGFKNFTDYLESESISTPPSLSKVRSGIKFLETGDFIRTFSLKKGQMKYFSTYFKTKESLAEWVMNKEGKKLDKKIYEEELRQRMLAKLSEKQKKYQDLKKKPIDYISLNHSQ